MTLIARKEDTTNSIMMCDVCNLNPIFLKYYTSTYLSFFLMTLINNGQMMAETKFTIFVEQREKQELYVYILSHSPLFCKRTIKGMSLLCK